ncbi:hypothetical protein MKX01_027227 [Papaver californicum]|nr:hypothetical protein MKX01_027227 [Papaver californicum]
MEGNSSNSTSMAVPFVLKTYEMVNDFPLEFSKRILPVYFKHNNFSSFVRQLNTYRLIFFITDVVRKKSSNNKNSYTYPYMVQAEEEQEVLLMEVGSLKREHEILNEEVEAIDKRLRTAERRPEQMLAFLSKVVNDPEVFTRMVQEKEAKKCIFIEKKRRFVLSARIDEGIIRSYSSMGHHQLNGFESSQDEYQQLEPLFYSSEIEEAINSCNI